MLKRLSLLLIMPIALAAQVGARPSNATTAVIPKPERAIRRDLPMTNMINRAFKAGTRDSSGKPGKNYWQTWVDYTINARLDSATHLITGSETVVFHNNSPEPIPQLRLRLDQNVFEPHAMRTRVIETTTTGMTLTSLAINGTAVNLQSSGRGGRGGGGRGGRGAAADNAGPAMPTITGQNTSLATISLPEPVPVGGTVTLTANWHFEVPNSNARGLRMGRWGDSLYQVGQWYPQIPVYDDLRGWDTDLYLGDTEFYNNFGHFDVKIDAPGGWIVGATGILQNPNEVYTADTREKLSHVLESDSQQTIVAAGQWGPGKSTMPGERLVWHFVADTVGDFAWGTSSQYVFDATRAMIPGRGYIPYYLMYLQGHQNFRQQGSTGQHALLFYSNLWMPYAWNQMTQVDGPEGGMEYPMFIMASGSTDHELGHQWWPMMVGVNETWYGFMDEGFNQYMNTLSNADRTAGGRGGAGRGGAGRGAAAAGGRGVVAGGRGAAAGGRGVAAGGRGANGRGGVGAGAATCDRSTAPHGSVALLNCTGQSYGSQYGDETYAPLMWDANYAGPRYQEQAYQRAPKMLSMLGGIVGDSAVWKAMSGYAKAWRFKHPSPWDYANYMNHALGQDLDWFWNYWLFTTEMPNGGIKDVKTAAGRTTVTVHQSGQMPSPVVLKVSFAPTGAPITKMASGYMADSVTQIITFPVDVWWNNKKDFNAVLNLGTRKIEQIVLDPFGRFPDKVTCDNAWPRPEGCVADDR